MMKLTNQDIYQEPDNQDIYWEPGISDINEKPDRSGYLLGT